MPKINKKIIFLAILIRLLVMPFFYHPDMKSQHFHFQFFSKGIFDIYSYIDKNNSNLGYKDTFNYLPLTYYTFGLTQTIIKPLLGNDFYLWVNDWGSSQNNYSNMIYFMLILKIPYLIFDLLTGYILLKIYKNKKVLYFWLFNPISIYLIYVLGNFDIIPTFLTLLSFYFIKSNKQISGYLSIGIAIALKMYPIMFLPFLFFYDRKNIFKNIKYALFSLLPLVLSVLPLIKNKSFYNSFLGSGLTQKILEYKIAGLPVFPILFMVILTAYIFSKSKYKFEIAILQTFLIFIGLVNFHPQWIMWFLPFLIIIFINTKTKDKIFFTIFFLLILAYIILFNDNYLTWGHLIPIDSNFINLTSPYQLIKLRTSFNPAVIQKTIHNLLLFLGITGSIFYAKNK